MPDEIGLQLGTLQKAKWVKLEGLLTIAALAMKKDAVTSISLLGSGSYNIVYKVVFSDGTCIAASISRASEESFNVAAKESELASMQFVRESGSYPTIPVPYVHAWDLTFANPVGAPYVLMESIEGETLDKAEIGSGDERLRGLDSLSEKEQLQAVNTLARVEAALRKPISSDLIGSPLKSEVPSSLRVGSMATLSGRTQGGPWKSLPDMWYHFLEQGFLFAMTECSLPETDKTSSPEGTPQEIGELLRLLAALVPHFVPPPYYRTLVLHHPDLALRNIIVDPEDHTKVLGVIDWAGTAVVPLILAGQYPGDIMTTGDSPFLLNPSLYEDGEDWFSVPYDWTSAGDPSEWPRAFGNGGRRVDYSTRVQVNTKRFWLRQYFGVCFSKSMQEIHATVDLRHARIHADSQYYLKFHEVICGGVDKWVYHKKWIRETFTRLQRVGPPSKEQLIQGPNTYKTFVLDTTCDLGSLERETEPQRNE